MKLKLFVGTLVWSALAAGPAAFSQDPVSTADDVKLINGKSQRDEILKAEREQNIKDSTALLHLAEGLKSEIENGDRFVLSMDTLKKTDDIEKLAKKIRSRLRH